MEESEGRKEFRLLTFDTLESMDFKKLMEVYRESNTENIPDFYPGCTDLEAGRKMVEARFHRYLGVDFFRGEGNRYYVLEEGGVWLSALRLFAVPGKEREYYLEALETRPEARQKGFAKQLITGVLDILKEDGSFVITDSVSKRNQTSLLTHLRSGFRIFQENAVNALNGKENPKAYGLRYEYKKEAAPVEVVAALIFEGDRFLICQRPANKARALLWEFVGGKVEPGETKEEALVRECREELDITLSVGDVFTEVTHEYPDITVHLTLFLSKIAEGTPKLLEHHALQWITPAEIPEYEFCPADTEILKQIRERFEE